MPTTVPERPATGTPKTGALSPFQSLQEEMERMFQAFSLPEMNWRSGLMRNTGSLGLRIDVSESDDAIEVTADLPGVREADIDVTLENDVLRIAAEKHTDTTREDEDKTWHVVERSYGRFERALRMPAGIDPESVQAGFRDGVLSIKVPKPAGTGPDARKIPVTPG